MSIFILILKIFGWILLGILGLLGLLLLTLGIALLVPIRYQGKFKLTQPFEQSAADFQITWLWSFFEFRFRYKDGKAKTRIRILWKKYFGANDTSDETKVQASDASKDESLVKKEPSSSSKQTKSEQDSENEQNSKNEQVSKREQSHENDRKPKSKKKRKSSKEPHESNLDSLKQILHAFSEENHQKAFKITLNELQYICRHYGPRKLSANLSYSVGDPAYTGYVLGMISVIPAIYHEGVHIYPDFESEQLYLKGTGSCAGRIRNIHVLKSFLILLIKKETRNVLKKLIPDDSMDNE